MVVIASYSIMKNKGNIRDKSNIAFISAIEKERESFISNFNIRYNPKYSPDSVSASEKIDWTSQAYSCKTHAGIGWTVFSEKKL